MTLASFSPRTLHLPWREKGPWRHPGGKRPLKLQTCLPGLHPVWQRCPGQPRILTGGWQGWLRQSQVPGTLFPRPLQSHWHRALPVSGFWLALPAWSPTFSLALGAAQHSPFQHISFLLNLSKSISIICNHEPSLYKFFLVSNTNYNVWGLTLMQISSAWEYV